MGSSLICLFDVFIFFYFLGGLVLIYIEKGLGYRLSSGVSRSILSLITVAFGFDNGRRIHLNWIRWAGVSGPWALKVKFSGLEYSSV